MSEEKSNAGRKTKRTPALEERLLESIRNGATQKDAALAAGVDETTLCRWKVDFPNFADSLAGAEAECAERMAACIAKAAPDDWRAAESWLKRRRREDWGDNVSHELDKDIANILAALAGSQEA